MHVVVVGCGRVGSELTGLLEAGGHSVAIVDKNERSFRRLPTSFTGRRVVGMGFDARVLGDAGIAEAGALASVTNGDNSNILVARVARESFGVERVVARIYDPRRAEIYQRVGIPTVATVSWTTDQVLRRLLPDAVQHDWTDATASVHLVERALADTWAGHRARELDVPGRITLVSVTRFGVARLVTDDLVLQQGDVLHLMTARESMEELEEHLSGATSARGGH